jgi:hypothetical protein
MDITRIISQIDEQIARLTKAKALLAGSPTKKGPGRPRLNAKAEPVEKKRTTKRSAEAKARMSAAQKARWAKLKNGK